MLAKISRGRVLRNGSWYVCPCLAVSDQAHVRLADRKSTSHLDNGHASGTQRSDRPYILIAQLGEVMSVPTSHALAMHARRVFVTTGCARRSALCDHIRHVLVVRSEKQMRRIHAS